MSFNNSAFNNSTVGPNGAADRHAEARTALIQAAQQLLHGGAVHGVTGLATASGLAAGAIVHPNPLAYELVPIFDPVIADYLSKIFCFTVRYLPLSLPFANCSSEC